VDRRLRLLRHRHHLPALRAPAPPPRQEAVEKPSEAAVRGPPQGQGRADAAGVHLPDAQRLPGRHAEDMRPGERHAPPAAVHAPARRLLAGGGASSDYCLKKGKVPILSIEAIHQLHIFIFALAVTHVVLSAVTLILGVTQTRKWKHWEEKIQQNDDNGPQMIKHVQEFKFIQSHFKGHGKRWGIFGWLRAFFKQFYGSVTEEDYTTLRLGFVMKHCRGHPKFNFYDYMNRALEVDFKKVVGISLYLWALLIIFLLLNVHGTICMLNEYYFFIIAI